MINKENHWLILERMNAHGKWDCQDVLSGIRIDSSGVCDYYDDIPEQDNKENIFVLFYNEPKTGCPHDTKLPRLINLSDWRGWRAWCHYGGDVIYQLIEDGWREWNGLKESDKELINDQIEKIPLPFTWSQDCDWKEDLFNVVKYIIEYRKCDDIENKKKIWKDILGILNAAWAKADDYVSFYHLKYLLSNQTELIDRIIKAKEELISNKMDNLDKDDLISLFKDINNVLNRVKNTPNRITTLYEFDKARVLLENMRLLLITIDKVSVDKLIEELKDIADYLISAHRIASNCK